MVTYLQLSGLSPQSLQENLVESTTFTRAATSALLKAFFSLNPLLLRQKEDEKHYPFVKSPNGFMHYPLPSDKRVHFYFKWPEHPESIYTA